MMRVQISITDDEGRVFEGEAELSLLGHGSGKPVSGRERSRKSHETKSGSLQTPVVSLNPRAFMKRYARGRSGPQKFTLLLACLAKGDSSREITFQRIRGQWHKMTSVIGKFNPSHSIRAKDNGWVDTKKQGVYVLTPSWKEVLSLDT